MKIKLFFNFPFQFLHNLILHIFFNFLHFILHFYLEFLLKLCLNRDTNHHVVVPSTGNRHQHSVQTPGETSSRFRCVSKPWCSLIDSPDFVKMHLQQSFRAKSNRKILLGFRNYSPRLVELRSLDFPGVDSIDSTQCLKPPFSDSIVLNSCNGVSLCHAEDGLWYFWNPFTGKYMELPPVPLARQCPGPVSINFQALPANSELVLMEAVKCGFAYVSETDEYKVVQVKEYRGFDWSYLGNEAFIFSSRSNQWERLEPFPYQIWPLNQKHQSQRVWGAHLNGALHTVVETGSLQWALMVFDTRSKQHSSMPKPEFACRYVHVTVEVLEGNLCVLHEWTMNTVDVQIDIWVMREYGVEDSWFKLFSVALEVEPHSIMIVYPLAYSDNGTEVLMNYKRKSLIWSGLKGKDVRKVAVNDVLPSEFYAEVSVETLVSLPGFISVDDGKGNSQWNDDVN